MSIMIKVTVKAWLSKPQSSECSVIQNRFSTYQYTNCMCNVKLFKLSLCTGHPRGCVLETQRSVLFYARKRSFQLQWRIVNSSSKAKVLRIMFWLSMKSWKYWICWTKCFTCCCNVLYATVEVMNKVINVYTKVFLNQACTGSSWCTPGF